MGFLYAVEIGEYALVQCASPEATSDEEDGGYGRVETILLCRLLLGQGRVEKVLSYRVASEEYFVGGKEPPHAFVGYTYLAGFLAETLVGEACEAVLLLYEARYAEVVGCVESGSAGIASYAYGYLRCEVAYDLFYSAFAAKEVPHHSDVFECPERAYETSYRETYYLVSCGRYTLHLHAPLCTYEEYFGLRILGFDGVGYAYGWENVASGATSTDDDSWFFHDSVVGLFVVSVLSS